MMAHAQKQDFVFRRYRRVYLNRLGGSIHSTTGGRAVHISLQGLYCSCKPVFCSHVMLTGYPLHSLVSPSLLLCVTMCHHISNAVYTGSSGSYQHVQLNMSFVHPCLSEAQKKLKLLRDRPLLQLPPDAKQKEARHIAD